MPDLVSIPLTPGQVEEFRRLAQLERDAQRAVAEVPIARSAAAKGILLGHHPLTAFDGQNLSINLDAATIQFTPNASAE